MPQFRSQHWLFGTLGLVSLGSVVYTLLVGDIGFDLNPERRVESQEAIDTLTSDMKRLLSSVSNWQAFCEDPYAYFKSASVHGSFAISVLEDWSREELLARSQIERDAMGRCSKQRDLPSTQYRLCLSVKESGAEGKDTWFDAKHIFEMNIEFREHGSRLIATCSDLAKKKVEVQSYFSAYTDNGKRARSGRISGGLRLPLEAQRL